jgi:hypothetical protein
MSFVTSVTTYSGKDLLGCGPMTLSSIMWVPGVVPVAVAVGYVTIRPLRKTRHFSEILKEHR